MQDLFSMTVPPNTYLLLNITILLFKILHNHMHTLQHLYFPFTLNLSISERKKKKKKRAVSFALQFS